MADHQNRFFHRKKIMTIFFVCAAVLCGLLGRLLYLMVWRAEYYEEAATRLHERERSIKAARGRILDRNGVVLADNKMVCTVSVIHNQIEEPEQVIAILVKELGISEEEARKRVEKYSSIERVKSNVDKTVGDRIREYDLAGVKVDEDYKRYYPYGDLASKVLGFTGGDNQGIIGLEVVYEEILQGDPGMILTITDAKGIEVDTAGERRVEPVPGMDLRISIDRNIQEYATQLAAQACATKEADSVYIVAMNPQNGEILAMVNYPEFDLNDPYTLPELTEVKEDGSIVAVDPATLTAEQKQEKLNAMWRNGCINDTYEPGSTFKIITAAAGLEAGVVTPESTFSCPGFIIVDDRKIRCHKIAGHGGQTFVQCIEVPEHRLHNIQIRVNLALQQILIPLARYFFINLFRPFRLILPIQGKSTQQALFGRHHNLIPLDVSLYLICIKPLYFFFSPFTYQFEEQELALDFFYV